MPDNAQNVKISSRAWEILRWAKLSLDSNSYSDVIITLDSKIKNRSSVLEKTLKTFDEKKHRIKVKTPNDISISKDKKPKTVLLRQDAHKILEALKVESNEPAYTFSDAIEFLAETNNLLPKHLKNH